jgi:hypothetical protein
MMKIEPSNENTEHVRSTILRARSSESERVSDADMVKVLRLERLDGKVARVVVT